MPAFDRSRSILQMTSPLGGDLLIPTSISGYEAISQTFSYRVQLVSEQSDIDPDSVLHQPGCIILRRDEEPARYFHGIFQEFAAAGAAWRGMSAYHAVLVPKFWFLNQTSDCRVFQEKSATEILQQMLQDAAVTATDFRIYNPPPVRHYTVQFNETDLQFATRLMEETGLFYFFEHAADAHTLVIADSNNAFKSIPDSNLRFDSNLRGEDVLTAWHRPRGTTQGKVTLKDYDPTKPNQLLQASTDGDLDIAGALARDVFMWPAATHNDNIVDERSRFMMQAAEASISVFSGAGAFRPLASGAQFTLQQDPVTGQQALPHVVRWMSFEAVDESWSTEGAPAFYANSFECFPATVPWRQPFSVARPDMGSVHSAIVLGPEGEEIYTDEYGRVKVQFFWDWRKEANPNQAIWARVVQPWAGNGWGTQFIPRVGTEVAVAFVDGDADRPLVLGGLYNGNQMPIYPLAQKTKSGLRTRSSLGGSTNDFNELTFDDNMGQELVFMQAQKDHTINVKHDQTMTVGHDQTHSIGHDQTLTVGHDQTATIDHDQTLTVKHDQTSTINNDQSLSVGNDQSISVGNDRTVEVSKAESITIGEGRTTEITDKDDQLTVKQGDLSIEVSQGKATITAMQSIELTVGSSSIRIDQTGVTITGAMITINGDAMVSISAPMASLAGEAITTITGGLVKIN